MRRIMIALVLAGSGIASALGGTTATAPGVPAFITANTNNIIDVYFPLSDRGGTPPACAANIGGNMFEYAIDGTTTAGRAQLAILLTAYATGATVWFAGTGTCTVSSNTETLAYAQAMPLT